RDPRIRGPVGGLVRRLGGGGRGAPAAPRLAGAGAARPGRAPAAGGVAVRGRLLAVAVPRARLGLPGPVARAGGGGAGDLGVVGPGDRRRRAVVVPWHARPGGALLAGAGAEARPLRAAKAPRDHHAAAGARRGGGRAGCGILAAAPPRGPPGGGRRPQRDRVPRARRGEPVPARPVPVPRHRDAERVRGRRRAGLDRAPSRAPLAFGLARRRLG